MAVAGAALLTFPVAAQRSATNPIGIAVPRVQTDAGPALLTPERVEAFAEAGRSRLNYLPGEVLMKFKAGATLVGRQRALSALRSRPSDERAASGGGTWPGFVMPPSPTLTGWLAHLSAQPEVEFAQPNYIRSPAGGDGVGCCPAECGARGSGHAERPGLPGAAVELVAVEHAVCLGHQCRAAAVEVIVAVIDTGRDHRCSDAQRAGCGPGSSSRRTPLRFATSPDTVRDPHRRPSRFDLRCWQQHA